MPQDLIAYCKARYDIAMAEPKKRTENAIALLKSDHKKCKRLFDEFENTNGRKKKKKIADLALLELKVHAVIEEEIFYPAVRQHVGKDKMNEADEEHHVVKILVAELAEMDGSEDHYDAKFKVLSENVRHHIKEEEGEMLPKARKMSLDFEALGAVMFNRQQELMKSGVGPKAEDKMVASAKGKGDSSARASRKKS